MIKKFLLCLLLAVLTYSPIFGESPRSPSDYMRVGWEERDTKYKKWLAPSVRIGGGSGTMVYFDETTSYVYVISAGHLFKPGRFKLLPKQQAETRSIEVFYHNEVKLPRPKAYSGEVLCYVWTDGSDGNAPYDVSLMRFKADWSNPWVLPIAPGDYVLTRNNWYHSVGCDQMSEVAHYLVQFSSERGRNGITELITYFNAPRGGRSGGGMFTDEGYLVGICSRAGGEVGMWSSIRQIHKFLNEQGYPQVLEGEPVFRIPVFDLQKRQWVVDKKVVPMPHTNNFKGGIVLVH